MIKMTLVFHLLLMKVFLFLNVYSDGILSKFHQNEYQLKDTRIEIASYNKKYVNIAYAASFRYNRSITAHNLTVNYKIDVKDELQITVQGFKFLSNEYRLFPIRFQVNFCDSLKYDVAGVGIACKSCGNFCPCYHMKNITYTFCNAIVDHTQMPPLLPSGRFMAECKIMHNDIELYVLRAYAEIYRPIKYD